MRINRGYMIESGVAAVVLGHFVLPTFCIS